MIARSFQMMLVCLFITFLAIVVQAPQNVINWFSAVSAAVLTFTLWLMYVWVTRRIWRRR